MQCIPPIEDVQRPLVLILALATAILPVAVRAQQSAADSIVNVCIERDTATA